MTEKKRRRRNEEKKRDAGKETIREKKKIKEGEKNRGK